MYSISDVCSFSFSLLLCLFTGPSFYVTKLTLHIPSLSIFEHFFPFPITVPRTALRNRSPILVIGWSYLLKHDLFSASACRGYFKVGAGQNNKRNYFGAKHNQNSPESILPPLPTLFFYIWTFSSWLIFRKYELPKKVFDYDCVTLYFLILIIHSKSFSNLIHYLSLSKIDLLNIRLVIPLNISGFSWLDKLESIQFPIGQVLHVPNWATDFLLKNPVYNKKHGGGPRLA